jgi:glycosyltransferase involved in cell wall biosynthesis
MTRDIVINGRFLSRQTTGVERFGREIIPLFRGSYRVEMTRVNGLAGHAWEQFILPTKVDPDSILWSPANTGPLATRNQAVTIHDLSPLEHPEWFKPGFASWYRLFLPILMRRVKVVFTPSNYVKQKVMKRFRVGDVIVAPNGVDVSRFSPDAKHCIHGLPQKYILFVGSLQPRKNLQTLLRAWHEIKNEFSDLWLVIAGDAGMVFAKSHLPAGERTMLLGYVNEKELPGIYAKATLFVLPSLDEGFGLPALEAMACGVPVIVSDGGALPETVGDSAMIFRIKKANDLTTATRECLENNELRLSLVSKGLERVKLFTWQKSADLIWKTLNEI